MNTKIYPVFIKFYDHASDSSWIDKHDLHDFVPNIVYQLGWLVDEDDMCYKVSGQVCDDGTMGDTMVIMKSSVIRVKKFKMKFPSDTRK